MTVDSTQPGVQIYTANFLSGQKGKSGVDYERHSCVCFETQNWPDAINQVRSIKVMPYGNTVLYVGTCSFMHNF